MRHENIIEPNFIQRFALENMHVVKFKHHHGKGVNMVSQDLLDILRCPACVREKEGLLELVKDTWLVCQDCDRKYPIVDDIPVMLIDEGDKWVSTKTADLPVPPPPMS